MPDLKPWELTDAEMREVFASANEHASPSRYRMNRIIATAAGKKALEWAARNADSYNADGHSVAAALLAAAIRREAE